ncbi:Hypothetical protein CAP_8253 [Chondromyces apiculatus DSM 436]|uniref:Uncharacterized protein n=1 Tax=Chondromyces apiculatus DSM 436 TaxID=1192034 RepID=A0A017TFP2_9BACT|nr:Hypothetical protein CAP_8253 [Chondromyces apiculatus DSM 436]
MRGEQHLRRRYLTQRILPVLLDGGFARGYIRARFARRCRFPLGHLP